MSRSYLPFEVTTRRDPQTWGIRQTRRQGWRRPAQGSDESRRLRRWREGRRYVLQAPVLVKPGTTRHSDDAGTKCANYDHRGSVAARLKGQSILVRDSSTERVMTAEVVDEDCCRRFLRRRIEQMEFHQKL